MTRPVNQWTTPQGIGVIVALAALFLFVGWLMLGRDQAQQDAIRAHYAPQQVTIGRTFRRCMANGLTYHVTVSGVKHDICVKEGEMIESW